MWVAMMKCIKLGRVRCWSRVLQFTFKLTKLFNLKLINFANRITAIDPLAHATAAKYKSFYRKARNVTHNHQ
jgi:hypothetical protein